MKKYLPWTFRIIIFILFIVSGITKMFPLWSFEKQLVDLGICGWCSAHYLARGIIALELALGVAVLQPHFLKKLVIPSTILLLVAFCIHLSIQMALYGNSGNCGCFGQLIEMTPLEALIKNIITIAILVYLWFNVQDCTVSKLVYPFLIFIAAALLMFIAFPFCPCEKEKPATADISAEEIMQIKTPEDFQVNDSTTTLKDSVKMPVRDTVKKVTSLRDTVAAKKAAAAASGPAKTSSKFAGFNTFGNQKADPDNGKKLICMFAPGCDHCRATAKSLCALSAKAGFPEIYILFMDEEANLIPDFFKEAGCTYPYQVLDIPKFWQVMGSGATTPAVYCLWNGHIVKSFEGIEKNQFDAAEMKKALELAP